MTPLGPDGITALTAWADLVSAGAPSGDLAWHGDIVAQLLRRTPVELVSLDELPDDAQCAAVAVVGSIVAMAELPLTGQEAAAAAAAFARHVGRPLDALVPLDVASVNALWPLHAAADLALPLVDADGMGRVFPLVRQTSFTLAGLSMAPVVAAGAGGEVVIIDAACDRHAERMLRTLVNAAGGWLLTLSYPTRAARLREAAIPSSISRALQLGAIVSDGADRAQISAGLRARAGCQDLGVGIVVECEHRTRPDAPEGLSYPASMVIELAEPRRSLRIELADQAVVAFSDGALVAANPDVIFLLDATSGQVRDLADVDLGDQVAAMVLPASPVWHTPAGLALAGPAAFGFPFPHPSQAGR